MKAQTKNKKSSASRTAKAVGSGPLVRHGWVILHPDGWVETDHFQRTNWNSHGEMLGPEEWRQKYRTDCQMVRATLTVPNQ